MLEPIGMLKAKLTHAILRGAGRLVTARPWDKSHPTPQASVDMAHYKDGDGMEGNNI